MTAVLVVDDDPAIVRALRRILESEGYSVRPAGSALEALRVADGVSLAVIDVMMPGMNGLELAERLRQDRPGFPILFVTGAPELVDLALFPGAHLIAKPWRVTALLDSVRQLLPAG
jgi:CheY-like chemotaxis protein